MRTARLFASARSRRVTLAVLAVLVTALVASSLLLGRYAGWLTDPFAVRRWIRGYGTLAPLVFVGLQALQVVAAPIPGQVLGLASGFLFGTLWGTVYSLAGVTVGSFVAFTLSRRFGRPYVERAVAAETLAEFDRFTDEEGPVALFLVFLIPGLPDDVICFLAGLTDMDVPKMVVIALVGRLPGFLVVNAVGAGLASSHAFEAAAVLAALVAASVLGYRYRERLFVAVLARTQR